MTNRDKYITKRNESDLMIAINQNTGICPIRAVAGISQEKKLERCFTHVKTGCNGCIQSWLNEEVGSEKEC